MQKKTASAIKVEAVFFYLGVIQGVICSRHKCQKQKGKPGSPLFSTGPGWSCYPDLNWGPHPYQATTRAV